MSVNPTNPGQLFGGSWEAIAQGTFLISAGTNYTVQNTYGSATHTHTQVATTSGGPSNNTSGGPSNNTSGGPSNNTSGSTAISIAQMPSHNHGGVGDHNHKGYGYKGQYGNHDRWFTTDSATDTRQTTTGWLTQGAGAHTHSSQGSGAGHTHTLSSHTHSLQSHTHSLQSHTHSTAATTTGSASNIPPSLAVYMWQRTG